METLNSSQGPISSAQFQNSVRISLLLFWYYVNPFLEICYWMKFIMGKSRSSGYL